jgi:hypothetical protein
MMRFTIFNNESAAYSGVHTNDLAINIEMMNHVVIASCDRTSRSYFGILIDPTHMLWGPSRTITRLGSLLKSGLHVVAIHQSAQGVHLGLCRSPYSKECLLTVKCGLIMDSATLSTQPEELSRQLDEHFTENSNGPAPPMLKADPIISAMIANPMAAAGDISTLRGAVDGNPHWYHEPLPIRSSPWLGVIKTNATHYLVQFSSCTPLLEGASRAYEFSYVRHDGKAFQVGRQRLEYLPGKGLNISRLLWLGTKPKHVGPSWLESSAILHAAVGLVHSETRRVESSLELAPAGPRRKAGARPKVLRSKGRLNRHKRRI